VIDLTLEIEKILHAPFNARDQYMDCRNQTELLRQLLAVWTKNPYPKASRLHNRIADLEKSSGYKWNGKFYGRKGFFSFWLAEEKQEVWDRDIDEMHAVNAARKEWDGKLLSTFRFDRVRATAEQMKDPSAIFRSFKEKMDAIASSEYEKQLVKKDSYLELKEILKSLLANGLV